MRRISCFHSLSAATDAAALLETHGFAATTDSKKFPGGDAIVNIAVDEGHVVEALEVIARDPAIHAMRCPECGSIYMTYPSQPENSPMAAMTEKLAEKLSLTERNFYCHHCQFEWSGREAEKTQQL